MTILKDLNTFLPRIVIIFKRLCNKRLMFFREFFFIPNIFPPQIGSWNVESKIDNTAHVV